MGSFTVKSLLTPLLTHPRATQLIKWTVYGALIINFSVYVYDDWIAYRSALAPDAPWADAVENFSTTIDTAAWLGLVFLFELETYALPDEAFTAWMTRFIRVVRTICYLGIAYAAYGYTNIALDYYDFAEVEGLTELCQIADQGRALQTSTIDYQAIIAGNCADISTQPPYSRAVDELAVIDAPTLDHVQKLSWVDVGNALVWLIVVLLIEIEIRMQAADRFGSRALKPARALKAFFYVVLVIFAVIWATTGYPIYTWDAFLWIFGFWAIELNLAEWEQQRSRELGVAAI